MERGLMAIITVSGEVGCRTESLARLVAQRLKFELISESRLEKLVSDEFGASLVIPASAWRSALTLVLARLASQHHLVVSGLGTELLFRNFPGVLRVYLLARVAFRTGNLMLEQNLDHPGARAALREAESARRLLRKER